MTSEIMTKFKYYSLSEAHLARGIGVVIDVLRAFTTAAYAFNAGAISIFPVSDIGEALELKALYPDALTMGEDQGYKPECFDFGNSPGEISRINLKGKRLIQRTSAGTQGIVKAVNAEMIAAASFVVAKSTADYLQLLKPDIISFIITGASYGYDGAEDQACGEYIEALVKNLQPKADEFVVRVKTSTVGQAFFSGQNKYLTAEDMQFSTAVDKFNFYLLINQEKDLLVMKKRSTS